MFKSPTRHHFPHLISFDGDRLVVGQGRNTCSGLGNLGKVQVSHNDARLVAICFSQNLPPGRYDHRVTIGLAAILVRSALRRREDATAGFNRPGTDQDMPMRFACGSSKGGRNCDGVALPLPEHVEKRWETHIEANSKAKPAQRRLIDCHDLLAWGVAGFPCPED